MKPVESGARFRQVMRARLEKAVPGMEARNELDTRADTIVAGINFALLSHTGQYCNVHGFSKEQEAIKDIPVATVATAWTDGSSGLSYILVIHEALYFGNRHNHSLINPNQIRITGIPVCDDPFDRYRHLGIEAEVFIPFETEGSAVYFASRTPTDEELEVLPRIELTSDMKWDPLTVDLSDSQPKEEIYSSISQVYRVHSMDEQHEFLSNFYTLSDARRVRQEYEQSRSIREVFSKTRHSVITPEHIARKWDIGLNKAKATRAVTTQRGIRYAIHPMHRKYKDYHHINYKFLNTQFYVDYMMSNVTSLSGNKGAYVYTTGKFTKVYPVATRTAAGQTLTEFSQDVGVPSSLRADLAAEFTGHGTDFNKEVRRLRINLTFAEKGHHYQNYAAESEIRELKRRWRRKMLSKGVPTRLWDFGLVHQTEIMMRMSRGQNGRTGYEEVLGETPDISEWLDFDFYDCVWYHYVGELGPGVGDEHRKPGRWLGVSHRVGADMCYWVLTQSGKVLARTTVQHVTQEDVLNDEVKQRLDEFDTAVKARLDDAGFIDQNVMPGALYLDEQELYGRSESEKEYDDYTYGDGTNTPSAAEYGSAMLKQEINDDDDLDDDAYDELLGAKLNVDLGAEGRKRATVKRRKRDEDGNLIGRRNNDYLLDTRQYEIEFEDGTYDVYFANKIVEDIWSQTDEDGHEHRLLKEICDHRADSTAITKAQGTVYSVNGVGTNKRTTRGWELLVEWKDGSTEWVPLRDLKDSDPTMVAGYAVANQIDEEPAFKWWVRTVLRRCGKVKKFKAKYWQTTHKFGVEIPKDVRHAQRLDEESGSTLWMDAIKKEMRKVKVAYKLKDGVTQEDVRSGKVTDMIGYQEITCHLIFDVKMDFTRKARFVAGGHTTEPPASATYASVVSRDSVRLAFLLASLNGMEILSCDVGNAYLNAPCREKIWFKGGPECGEDQGGVMVITRALYGLKSAGASWRAMLSDTLQGPEFGFRPAQADQDVYLRRRSRPNDSDYYEMVLVYVDDILCVSYSPKLFMDKIGKIFELRDTVKAPEVYLGADIEDHQFEDGTRCWALSSKFYVTNAVKVVEGLLHKDGKELRTTQRRGQTPMSVSYKPELEASEVLDADCGSWYLQLIGILRWAVELGRFDIALETAIMSQYSAEPRVGHIEAVYGIFAYLKVNPEAKLVFDPSEPFVELGTFNEDCDWKAFYGDIKEPEPVGAPEPLGQAVTISCFCDANHAGNVITRRSHSGIIIFVQNAPIIWFSKKQNTVEASTFGAELVAMRIARDLISALRIKLRTFGVPLSGPANLYCDNQGVVKNMSVPESTLSKKHNAINYHVMRESAAMGMLRVGKEDTETNMSDLLTKVLNKPRRDRLIWNSGLHFPRQQKPT